MDSKNNPETCERILMQFPDVEGGELDELRLQRFDAHIAACPACAQAWCRFQDAVERAQAALRGGPMAVPEGAPDDYWDTFLPRLRGRMDPPAPSRYRANRPVWALPAAAALVLGFCLGAFSGTFSQTPAPIQPPVEISWDSEDSPHEMEAAEDFYLPLSSATETAYDATYDLVDSLDEAEIDLLVQDLLGDIS